MTQKQILIHYGELSTKGHNKKMFTNRLAEHIRLRTKHIPDLKIFPQYDFMHLKWESATYDEIIAILKFIPGISRFEPVYPVAKELGAIQEKALALFAELGDYEGKSFRVVAKRSDKSFEYDTLSLQRQVGDVIGEAYPQLSVDLRTADYKLTIAIHQDGAYLSLISIPGLGGMPYGSSGKGLLMLSGGFDSPIAGYLMMKRGMEIEAVHFASPPYTSPQALEKTKKLTAKLAAYGKPIRFHEVPFTAIQEAIKEAVPDDFSMTVMRRMMVRIMDQLLIQQKAQAIVNGESLGQVASQTMKSMAVINEVTHTPILRPLIATDKNEIIELAVKIDTYALSNEPFEDCCTVFAPKSPKTKPRLSTIQAMEEALNIDELVSQAVAGTRSILIDHDYQPNSQVNFGDLL
ncbi:tRNA uracil 4-sulfurtransferase ThiI [Vaginisenegalia massiliensis]|uniref:tRNA uracil 4-sulfurtransferase ThiI n=1 Tax=Vaginisenegalia massiliensis TaxID=2058294 RepID=UPI001F150266|nr:tRNA uracil 4-sulfurtransferase ThiI [Vaginisenegalia massiliensis]